MPAAAGLFQECGCPDGRKDSTTGRSPGIFERSCRATSIPPMFVAPPERNTARFITITQRRRPAPDKRPWASAQFKYLLMTGRIRSGRFRRASRCVSKSYHVSWYQKGVLDIESLYLPCHPATGAYIEIWIRRKSLASRLLFTRQGISSRIGTEIRNSFDYTADLPP